MTKKKSNEYWANRFDQIEQAQNNKSVRYIRELERKYALAFKDVQAKIESWYNRLAKNNEVTVEEARKLLNKNELKEFKWTVEQYIKAGRENAIDQRWLKELENASSRFHIRRLEALQLEIRHQIEMLMNDAQTDMYDTLKEVYKDGYYKTCYEIQKGIGVGFDVSLLNSDKIKRILVKPWAVSGWNFSETLWGNKKKLINLLDQSLSRMVLTGQHPNTVIKELMKTFKTSEFNARRLVLTEQAYFTTLAQNDGYKETKLAEYQIVAIMDGKTCDDCQDEEGKHYPVDQMEAGVTAPPFHPYCRCTTAPYIPDDKSLHRVIDNKGNTYHIPSNMSFKQWKDINGIND